MSPNGVEFFFLALASLGGMLTANACGRAQLATFEDDDGSAPTSGSGAASSVTATAGGAMSIGSATSTSVSVGAGGSGGATGSGGEPGGGDGGGSSEVKVAFWGDSQAGSNFVANLNLAKNEGADFIIHEGDFDYNEEPVVFWSAIDNVLGHQFPYFLAVGNHDDGAWVDPYPVNGGYSYVDHMLEHFAANGIVVDDPDLSDEMYSTEYLGIRMVMAGQNGNNDAFTQFVNDELEPTDTRWKLCNWHKNQNAMQVGGKGDEMGWPIYEACRANGAIIVTGHEHSYSRTKTLTNMENQTVDATCSERNDLCVGPGRTFAVVQGLGGHGVRVQKRCLPATTYPYDCNGEWAKIYTQTQGAEIGTMFITFNVGGDPNKATGYFKTITGTLVDHFIITKD